MKAASGWNPAIIMSLGIISGSTVTLSAVGADEEAAVTALDALLQRDVY